MRAPFTVTPAAANGGSASGSSAARPVRPGPCTRRSATRRCARSDDNHDGHRAPRPAGDVTFVVKNAGTIEHEMIVLKTDTPFDQAARRRRRRSARAGDHRREQGRRERTTSARPATPTSNPARPGPSPSRSDRRQVRARVQPRRSLPDGHARPVHGPMTAAEHTSAPAVDSEPAAPVATIGWLRAILSGLAVTRRRLRRRGPTCRTAS